MSAAEFRAILSALGLTQRGAAERLGVTQGAVAHWAGGRTPIAADKAALIRERLGGKSSS